MITSGMQRRACARGGADVETHARPRAVVADRRRSRGFAVRSGGAAGARQTGMTLGSRPETVVLIYGRVLKRFFKEKPAYWGGADSRCFAPRGQD